MTPIVPREWFLVPLFIIDEVIEKIKDGTVAGCTYDVRTQMIERRRDNFMDEQECPKKSY